MRSKLTPWRKADLTRSNLSGLGPVGGCNRWGRTPGLELESAGMAMNDLCAIVVTFHPGSEVMENLTTLRPQVAGLIVVDNGSSAAERYALHSAAATLAFELIENGENLGIATALNIGIRRAQALGFSWVLLFDQDSRITDGFTAAMRQCFESSRWGSRLAILVPRYTDMRHGSPIPADWVPGSGLETAMTSGTLMRLSTFQQQGAFLDGLFIDSVDCEYSLRLRRAGLILDQCPHAVLLHSPGSPTYRTILGSSPFVVDNYSPIRRYYQLRNRLWICRHYWLSFPGYCFKLLIVSAKDFVKILLCETGNAKKLRFFLRGVFDGLRGRMGPLNLP